MKKLLNWIDDHLLFLIYILVIILALSLLSCQPTYIDVKITYIDGSTEIMTKTKSSGNCPRSSMKYIKAGCTYCLEDTRCGVRKMEILKVY